MVQVSVFRQVPRNLIYYTATRPTGSSETTRLVQAN